jgi:hypothetical protein
MPFIVMESFYLRDPLEGHQDPRGLLSMI